jgi:hypothetical protein
MATQYSLARLATLENLYIYRFDGGNVEVFNVHSASLYSCSVIGFWPANRNV